MPGRNLLRAFTDDAYYHVYNRGVNRRRIFLDEEDYLFFTNLFHRHIDSQPTKDSKHREYRWLADDVQLLAYCLMPNHFHLLLYQYTEHGIRELLQSMCTAYTMYFNKKYKRRGPLFENNYRASMVSSDTYLQHISRYIHLNPKEFKEWPYSSYKNYLQHIPGRHPGKRVDEMSWLHSEKVLELFDDINEYATFVDDYAALQRELDGLKHELADH